MDGTARRRVRRPARDSQRRTQSVPALHQPRTEVPLQQVHQQRPRPETLRHRTEGTAEGSPAVARPQRDGGADVALPGEHHQQTRHRLHGRDTFTTADDHRPAAGPQRHPEPAQRQSAVIEGLPRRGILRRHLRHRVEAADRRQRAAEQLPSPAATQLRRLHRHGPQSRSDIDKPTCRSR